MLNLKEYSLLLYSFIVFQVTGWSISSECKVACILKDVHQTDQKFRSLENFDPKKIIFPDRLNLLKVKAIIKKYNWPDDDFIDFEQSRAIFLVIQHSKLDIQKRYFPLVEKAVFTGKLKRSHLGLLEDRIAVQEGSPQKFGTQIGQDLQTGEYSVFPVYCPELLDERRKEIGLQPMVEYLKLWNTSVEKNFS